MKQCTKCRSVKALEGFSKDARKKDGLAPQCRECRNAWAAIRSQTPKEKARKEAWRAENPETQKAAERKSVAKRKASGALQESSRKANANHRAKFPLKAQAHDAVSNAIKTGKLKPAWWFACDNRCGHVAQEYHHSAGYGEAAHLTVTPLCIPCHRAEHKLLQKLAQNLAKGLGSARVEA